MIDTSGSEPRLYSHWPALVVLTLGLYVVWLSTAPYALGRGLFPATLVFLVRAIVVWAASQALGKMEQAKRLHAWRVFVVGLMIWLAVDALSLIEWSLSGTLTGAPSFRDLLRLAGYLAIGYALATYPMSHPERFGRVREALDMLILFLAILSLAWLVFFRPAASAGYLNIPQIFWLSINPVLDIVLLVLALRQALLRVRIRGSLPFLLISMAAAIMFVSDLGASFEGLDVPPPASLVQAGWMAATALFGFAVQQSARDSVETDLALDHEPVVRLASRLEPLIPVALTYAVVAYLLFDLWFSGSLDWVGVGLSVTLIVLLFGRQAVILGQQEMRQFAALVNATGDLAFIADQGGVLRMANPALLSLLDRPAGQGLLALRDFISIPAGSSTDFEDLLVEAAQRGWSGEVMLRANDSTPVPVLLSLDPVVSASTGQVMIAGTGHDLSLIRKREDDLRVALDEIDAARAELAVLNTELESKVEDRTRELQQTVADLARLNEELTTLDQLKSEFVALVSHELRSPLTNIRSGIELVLEAHPDINVDTRDSLALVQEETSRLSHFVETILDLSALEAGKFHLEKQALNVVEAFENARQHLTRRIGDREIIAGFEDDLPVLVSDRSAIESVFYHLLDNGLKYAPDSDLKVRGWVEGNRLFVSIEDHGPGIPPAQHEKVFDMFHRLDASDARDVYGHGLGLPMVKRLLEALGGSIMIENSSRQGTTVKFWVPVEGP